MEASESGSSKELLLDNSGVAASEPSQSLRQRMSTLSPATLTHKRVTDPVMSEALDALSLTKAVAQRYPEALAISKPAR